MKRLLVVLNLLLILQAQAQDDATRSVFVELGGPSLVYSFNYDFRFAQGDLEAWGMRIGAGGFKINDRSRLCAVAAITAQLSPRYTNGCPKKEPRFFILLIQLTNFSCGTIRGL